MVWAQGCLSLLLYLADWLPCLALLSWPGFLVFFAARVLEQCLLTFGDSVVSCRPRKKNTIPMVLHHLSRGSRFAGSPCTHPRSSTLYPVCTIAKTHPFNPLSLSCFMSINLFISTPFCCEKHVGRLPRNIPAMKSLSSGKIRNKGK